MEKKIYSKPVLETEEFEAQEYCWGAACTRIKSMHMQYINIENPSYFDYNPATEKIPLEQVEFSDLICYNSELSADGSYQAQATEPTGGSFGSYTTEVKKFEIGGKVYYGEPSSAQHS